MDRKREPRRDLEEYPRGRSAEQMGTHEGGTRAPLPGQGQVRGHPPRERSGKGR